MRRKIQIDKDWDANIEVCRYRRKLNKGEQNSTAEDHGPLMIKTNEIDKITQ